MAFVTVPLSLDETRTLLKLVGHDHSAADHTPSIDLVEMLYRTLAAFDGAGVLARLGVSLTREQLRLIHRHFTVELFGEGGRDFEVKLARAFVEFDRRETLPEIDTLLTAEGAEFGADERRRLAKWRELDS